MNYGDVVDDFLCEVRERGGFANDKTFDQIVGQVFFDKIKAAIEEEREACAKVCKEMSQYAKDVVMDKNAQKECRIALNRLIRPTIIEIAHATLCGVLIVIQDPEFDQKRRP